MFPPQVGLPSPHSTSSIRAGHGRSTSTTRALILRMSPPPQRVCGSTTGTTATHNQNLSHDIGARACCFSRPGPLICNGCCFTPGYRIRQRSCQGYWCQRACPTSMKDPPDGHIRPAELLHCGRSRSASMTRKAGPLAPVSSHSF